MPSGRSPQHQMFWTTGEPTGQDPYYSRFDGVDLDGYAPNEGSNGSGSVPKSYRHGWRTWIFHPPNRSPMQCRSC
jgi:hypothetical protein